MSKQAVELDTASFSKLTDKPPKKKGKKKGGAKVETKVVDDAAVDAVAEKLSTLSTDASSATLSEANTRAVLVCQLIALMTGRAFVRPAVVQFLADVLNSNVLPSLPASTDKECLSALADMYNSDSALVDQLTAANVTSPGPLTDKERASFVQGISASAGIAALAAFSVSTLLNVADLTAAMSMELYQAFTEPFQAVHHEQNRPYSGAIQVCKYLRNVLQGSKRTDKAKRADMDPVCFRNVPYFHGTARQVAPTVIKAIKCDFNNTESGPADASSASAGEFHSFPLAAYVLNMISPMVAMASISLQRMALLAGDDDQEKDTVAALEAQVKASQSKLSTMFPSISSAGTETSLVLSAEFASIVALLTSILGKEADLTTAAMCAVDVEERKAQTAAIAKKLEAMKKREEAEAAKLAKMIAEGKEPKKNKKKKDKKGGLRKTEATGVALGSGTMSFFKRLQQEQKNNNVAAFLDPQSGSDIDAFSTQILNALNTISKPKIPKGTRDADPSQMAIREKAFRIIKNVFSRHGAVGIDTPVFERRETLMGKYGEDSKLIYDLADQGGEILSLRYDLTVPFARYCASHKVKNIRRYHIARVYRRDNPVMSKGRFREFYQCDYDIAGDYNNSMVPDSDVLKVLTEVLDELDIGEYKVKLNHRKLLDGLMDICGVPAEKFRTICSAVDKLDKEPWEKVRDEMVNQKGLDAAVADKLGSYVTRPALESPIEMLKSLREEPEFAGHAMAQEAFVDLEKLFAYLQAQGCLNRISFDLSLARGLDYYTGVIYEAMLLETGRVGSIAAGGRYDGLVGMFSGAPVPAVGVSVGIERIFAILEDLERKRAGGNIRKTQTFVLVGSVGKDLLLERMKLCGELWKADLKAEYLYDLNPKPKKQIDYALENQIEMVVWIGEEEMKNGVVKVKNMGARTEEIIPRTELIEYLKKARDSM